MLKKDQHIKTENSVEEPAPVYGFVSRSEEEKLIEDIFRPDIEKLQLFTRMLRNNGYLKQAIITHKKLVVNEKAVSHRKNQLDVPELEKIKKIREKFPK